MPKEPGEPNIYQTPESPEDREAVLEKERQEFLAGLLLPEKKDIQDAVSNAFRVNPDHLAVFMTDLVYSLPPEKLVEFQSLCADISVKQSFECVGYCIEEIDLIQKEGKGKEHIGITQAKDLLAIPRLIKIMTGKSVSEIDFLTEDSDLATLAGNPSLATHIESLRQLENQMIAEKKEKYRDILEEDFDGEIPDDFERVRGSLSDGYVSNQITERVKEKIKEFAKQNPLAGKRVFELGGNALAEVTADAGAEAVNFDAKGFDWKKWQFAQSESELKLKNTMNSENCMALLDQVDPNHPEHQFDLTTSRMVFDQGSGIESTTASGEYKDAAIELLKVLARTTRPGGYSIHQTGGLEILGQDEEQVLHQLGFAKVFELNQHLADDIVTHPYFMRLFAHSDEWSGIRHTLRSEGVGGNFTYPTVVLRRI